MLLGALLVICLPSRWKRSIHHFFSPWGFNLLIGADVKKNRTITACFFPSCFWLKLSSRPWGFVTLKKKNLSSSVLKAKPVGNMQAQISLNHGLQCTFAWLKTQCKPILFHCATCFVTTALQKDLCVRPIVLLTATALFTILLVTVSAHPLDLDGTPRMWPGWAGRVCPQTKELPRSPLMRRWHLAVILRWMTGTGPCQLSALGVAHLQKRANDRV